MRQKVQREFCLTVSCVLVTIKNFLRVAEGHQFNHAQNLVLFWMKSTLSGPHFCLDKSKKSLSKRTGHSENREQEAKCQKPNPRCDQA